MPDALLSVTPAIRSAVEALAGSAAAGDDADLVGVVARLGGADHATLAELRAVAAGTRAHLAPAEARWLHELIVGSTLVSAPTKAAPRARDPELARRLERLENARQNQEYARMVRDITSKDVHKEREANEIASYKASMGVGVNMLVSVATMFTAGWFVTKNALGAGPTDVLPIIGGLLSAAATLLLETWLFVIRTSRVDSAASKRDATKRDATKRSKAQHTEFSDLSRIHDHYD